MVITSLTNILVLAILIDVLLSYFLPPDNSVRSFFDRILEPLFSPIRRVIKPIAGLDFSPTILVILIWVIQRILLKLLSWLL